VAASQIVLRVLGLSKDFGYIKALQEIDLTLERGQVLALFGPNGAGKTTLLRVLATLTRPSAGEIQLLDVALPAWEERARRYIGLVTHRSFLFPDLTVEENLCFYGQLYEVEDLPARIEEVLAKVNLEDQRHHLTRVLSPGLYRRATIARVLLHNPTLLLLDEPYGGLGSHATDLLDGIVRAHVDQGKALILTSHNLAQSLKVCDRWAILRGGRIVAQGMREEWQGSAFYDGCTRA
jgi:heme exporter protein A